MDGNWRNLAMRLDLRALLVNMRAARVDKWSYYDMDKTNGAADLFHCEKTWKKDTNKACVSDKEEKKNPAKIVAAKVTSSKVKQLFIGTKLTKCVVQRVEDKENKGLVTKVQVVTGCVCSVTSIHMCGSQRKKKCWILVTTGMVTYH
jgi:hypothetical protein